MRGNKNLFRSICTYFCPCPITPFKKCFETLKIYFNLLNNISYTKCLPRLHVAAHEWVASSSVLLSTLNPASLTLLDTARHASWPHPTCRGDNDTGLQSLFPRSSLLYFIFTIISSRVLGIGAWVRVCMYCIHTHFMWLV